jgi:protein SCO1
VTKRRLAQCAAAAAFLIATSFARAAETLRAGAFDPPRDAPDFTLRGTNGNELVLSRYRGKVVLLAFGFASCPVICPTTLATLTKTRKELGPDADGMQVLYVTVDPERDDVDRLRLFLAGFDPSFVGGTGTAAELAAVRNAYGVQADKVDSADAYMHSTSVYLIDRDGKLRALMPYGNTSEDYVHDVKLLLGR